MTAFGQDSVPAFDTSNMNLSSRPGGDFYEYVNGNWIKNHPVPPDKPTYNEFWAASDKTDEQLREIVEEAANNTSAKDGSIEEKIGLFYRLGMDTAQIEKQGLQPLKDEFDLIENISSARDVQRVVSWFMSTGTSNPLFTIDAEPDFKNSKMMMAMMYQGGLGLPDKDYYFRGDNHSIKTREDYLNHVANMFVLLNDSPAAAEENARTVMRIETRMASASFSNEENRDMDKIYNPMTRAELQEMAPGFDWALFFDDIGYPGIQEVNICNPPFFRELGIMMQEESIEDWKTFLRWKLISDTASFLPERFVNESFNFYGKKLNGQEELEPRWKRVLYRVDGALGDAVGQIYVQRHFDPQSKASMQELTANLKAAFRSRLKNLTWMEDSTKARALEKLDAMDIRVGYPDKWLDYSGLEIKEDSYLQNAFRGASFNFRHGRCGLDRAGKPVDQEIWYMTPQTVNAYSDPFRNLIVFPAALLQPPIFNPSADDAVNYGSIGQTIGHEMIHGFDDQGRKFDCNGNMTDWWTDEDKEAFNNSTRILANQFDAIEVMPGLHINGNLTLGETIAELGGLIIAYNAYRLSHADEAPMIDGFEDDQRFFLSYAQYLRESTREESLRTQVQTDPHPPCRFWVNGVISNVPEFYEAFPEVKQGDNMYRPEGERAIIW